MEFENGYACWHHAIQHQRPTGLSDLSIAGQTHDRVGGWGATGHGLKRKRAADDDDDEDDEDEDEDE